MSYLSQYLYDAEISLSVLVFRWNILDEMYSLLITTIFTHKKVSTKKLFVSYGLLTVQPFTYFSKIEIFSKYNNVLHGFKVLLPVLILFLFLSVFRISSTNFGFIILDLHILSLYAKHNIYFFISLRALLSFYTKHFSWFSVSEL